MSAVSAEETLDRSSPSKQVPAETPAPSGSPAGQASAEDPSEQAALRLVEELRAKSPTPPGKAFVLDDASRQRLQMLLERAFEARNRQQAAEVQSLRQRLEAVSQQLVNRQQLKKSIIERRLEELVSPGLKWDDSTVRVSDGSQAAKYSPTPAPVRDASRKAKPAPENGEEPLLPPEIFLHIRIQRNDIRVDDDEVVSDGNMLQKRLIKFQYKYPDKLAIIRPDDKADGKVIREVQQLCLQAGVQSILAASDPPGGKALSPEEESAQFPGTGRLPQRGKARTKNEEAIFKALAAPTKAQFVDTQLPDALKFLQDQHGINIFFDWKAMQEESIRTNAASTLMVSNISLYSVLNLLLKPHKLGFTIEDEVLKIVPRSRLAHRKMPDELLLLPYETPAILKNREQIARTLRKPISVGFVDTQLTDALSFLSKQHALQIIVDERALAEQHIPTNTAVNLNLSDISLRSVLNLMLEPQKLSFSIEDEVLMIKPARWTPPIPHDVSQRAAPIAVERNTLPPADTKGVRKDPARYGSDIIFGSPAEFSRALMAATYSLHAAEKLMRDDGVTEAGFLKKKQLQDTLDEYNSQMQLLQIQVSRAAAITATAFISYENSKARYEAAASITNAELADSKLKWDLAKLDLEQAKTLLGTYQKLTATAAQNALKALESTPIPDIAQEPLLGLKLHSLSRAQLPKAHLTKFSGGLRIVEVIADGPASRFKFQAGDILISFDKQGVQTLKELSAIVEKLAKLPTAKRDYFLIRGNEIISGTVEYP